jgi:hypothetical protein
MSETTLKDLQQGFAQAKKTGHEGWLELEVALYIAEALDDIRHLLKDRLITTERE